MRREASAMVEAVKHTRLFDPIRERTCHWLGDYLAREAVERDIAHYIVPPGLDDRSGILGALRLAVAVDPDGAALSG